MEVVNEIVKGVVQVLMEPVKAHLRCMISYREYVELMQTKMNDLEAATVGVEDKKKQNIEGCREVPAEVDPWLSEVEKMKAKVPASPNDEVLGCLDLKSRHKLGRKAFKMFKETESLLGRVPQILGTEPQIPPGRVDSTKASTSTPLSGREDFPSRVQTKRKALEALKPDHKDHMVALWGMGGVGKTTMMKELKEVVEQKNMFKYIVRADIGEKPNIDAIQESIADYLGIKLEEQDKNARAEKLCKVFKAKSEGGKSKFLIILDDVWQPFDMDDIGLSTLPNQGDDFKVLLTARKKDVCTGMGVEADSVLNVRLLEEDEARSFFLQFVNESDYLDLKEIGDDIVRRCQGLPIAIKTIGRNLRGQRKHVWEAARARLQHHDIDKVVKEVFEMSYTNLPGEEGKIIFLLCGLFPEDFDIPIEELMRYGWGLKIFNCMYSISDARNMLKTCIDELVDSNLLIRSDNYKCVKMHDMVRAFVLDVLKEGDSGEHASIVNHGRSPGWPEDIMSASSCKSISITCKGMSEFPSELTFPNLTVLKLIHGDESLRFPRGFYGGMEKLQVISYDQMKYPLLPPSPHKHSSNLRVLLLHRCTLACDLSSVGNLSNLEVLSFANSRIESLPSTIGNLKKLRVLDLTNYCTILRIDNCVLKKLVMLKELYAYPRRPDQCGIMFTGDDCNEVAERWKNLSALEFQFYEINAQVKNLSFENLERFNITVGSYCNGISVHRGHIIENKNSFENRLMLETKKGELLKSRIYELFEKTVKLSLSVDDMKNLEEVGVKSSLGPQSSSFANLRSLVVSRCAQLKYLFTLGVAKQLSNLEDLEVSNCRVMKELVHTGDMGEETITFPKLKFLCLLGLPELLGLCQNVNIIALPQLIELKIKGIQNITSTYSKNKSATSCLFMEEVLIPELEKLHIENMNGLKEIWPCDFLTSKKKVKLREIRVIGCDNLVNIFPCNPMPLLHNLENLKMEKCGSIEALFDINLDCVGELGEEACMLRMIDVREAGKLREVWRIRGGENNSRVPIHAFQAVESIMIRGCKMFRFLFNPTTTNVDIRALIDLNIKDSGEIGRINGLVESSQEQEVLSKEETLKVSDVTLFPSYLTHSFHKLRQICLESYEGVEVVFEMESPPRSQDNQQPLFPCLKELYIGNMERMSHVWKCNWNEFLILHKKPSVSPFHNLTTISVNKCKSITYLISPLMARLLSNLKKVYIRECDGIEEVVSHRDDEDKEKTASTSTHTSTTLFPRLDKISLEDLKNLKCIGGGGGTTSTTTFLDQYKFCQMDGVSWTLCQYPREIEIEKCDALSSVIPCYAARQMKKLQVLRIESCKGMKEVFETQRINSSVIMLKLGNLKILKIKGCDLLEHIFTSSTLETLGQLEELSIVNCKAMKVIVVKEEEDEGGERTTMGSSSMVDFHCLKRIELKDLPELVGFFLGTNEFHWPSLDDLTVSGCPQMKVFTAGGTTAPQLKYVNTRVGRHLPGRWLKSHMTTTTIRQHQESTNSSCPAATLEGFNAWSFHNLIALHVENCIFGEKIIVPSNELLHLQKLEKIHLNHCMKVEEVFEELEGTDNTTGFHESPTVEVNLPNLTQVNLQSLHSLRYIWKSNRWTLFEFPNLTTLSLNSCTRLQHVFTSSMLGSLKQLQELSISHCYKMEEVIVKDTNVVIEEKGEEDSDGKMNEIVLPCLKSLQLNGLHRLKGFCLGMFDFAFPLLDTLKIMNCPAIKTFTTGKSSTPKLKEIKTSFGSSYVEEDINSFIKMKQEEFKTQQW